MPEFYSGATGNPAASVRDYCSGAYTGQFVTLSTECMVVRHADHVWWYIGCSMGLLDPKSIGIAGPKMKPRKLRTELNQAAE